MIKRVLFVCTGNTCRSPMAEELLNNKASDIQAKSAGVYAMPGSGASAHAQQVLKEKNILTKHSAQAVSADLLAWADLVLTMTENHKHIILQSFPESSKKVFTLKEYVIGDSPNQDISDPFGGPLDVYKQTAEEIERLIDKLIENEKSK